MKFITLASTLVPLLQDLLDRFRRPCQIASLHLADTLDETLKPEVCVLIGGDYYGELVMGGVSRGAHGPTAIHTMQGWVLSGPAPLVNSKQSFTNLVSTHVLRIDYQSDSLENF